MVLHQHGAILSHAGFLPFSCANIAEIDVGKLAQEKGKNPAVKQYGAMLVKDHGAAK